MTSILSQPLVERIAWTLLHFLWEGVLIAKVFAAARAVGARSMGPRGRYALSCAALAAMVLAPFVTFALIGSGSPLMAASAPAWVARPFAAADSQPLGEWSAAMPVLEQRVLPWIVAVWLCGVATFSIRLAGGWIVVRRTRASKWARPAAAEWQARLEAVMARVGVSRPVKLLASSLARTPMAIGYLRPAILMPMGALTGLPPEQIEALLAHELEHIRRHDYLVNLLQSAAEALLFYHPCVWWISNEIRAERERCCDDAAVAISGDVLVYASALASVEAERSLRLQMAMAASGGSLADRIRRLLDPAEPTAYSRSAPGAAAALSLFLLAGVGAAAMNGGPMPKPAVHLIPPAVSAPAQIASAPPITVTSPSKAPHTVRRRTEPRRTESTTEPAPATQLSAARNEPEGQQFRFGEFVARTWAAVEGEPVLHRIEFRGMTPELARALQERLPVRIGEPVSHEKREEIGDLVREYGRRLEFGLFADSERGAVLRIHPPGAAGEPLVETEPRRK